jgi:uncharacterized lipoprotein YddW (UPF0748 family)
MVGLFFAMLRRDFLQRTALATAVLPFGINSVADPAPEPIAPRKLTLSAPLTHSDWMLKPSIAWGAKGVHHMLDQCKECGWNEIYWRVTDGGRALYQSKLMRPGGKWDEDSFWNPQSEGDKALFRRYYGNYSDDQRHALLKKFEMMDYSHFDSFAEAIRYGHKIGLKIHAWVTINEDDHGWGLQSEFTKKHPEFRWHKRNGTAYHSQLSFAYREVRNYKLGLLRELLKNYEMDGLFLDWIRTGDVRDNPQNDADGAADYGYEKPNLDRFKKKFKKSPLDVSNHDNAWVRLRAEPQTEFMREVHKLLRKQKRALPVTVLVGHPWHYRGEQNKIDGNLRGMLIDLETWAKEGLITGVVAAGYYRDGGNAELAARALQKETAGKVDVWTFAWVPSTVADFEQTAATADKVGARHILFWEADYIDDKANAAELKSVMKRRAL